MDGWMVRWTEGKKEGGEGGMVGERGKREGGRRIDGWEEGEKKEGWRQGGIVGVGDGDGKFHWAASFQSIRTGSDCSVSPSTWAGAEGTGLNVFTKPNFSWVPSNCQALIWVRDKVMTKMDRVPARLRIAV